MALDEKLWDHQSCNNSYLGAWRVDETFQSGPKWTDFLCLFNPLTWVTCWSVVWMTQCWIHPDSAQRLSFQRDTNRIYLQLFPLAELLQTMYVRYGGLWCFLWMCLIDWRGTEGQKHSMNPSYRGTQRGHIKLKSSFSFKL